MAKRPTQDAWQAARQRWEADPAETLESIGKSLSISREAVRKKSDKEGWHRPTSLRQIVEKAQIQADVKLAKLTSKLTEVDAATSKATEQAAVDVRTNVLTTHRTDWIEHRELFGLQAIAADFEQGKSAKISAEMLTIRQKGERAAYGLDATDSNGSDYEALLQVALAQVQAI